MCGGRGVSSVPVSVLPPQCFPSTESKMDNRPYTYFYCDGIYTIFPNHIACYSITTQMGRRVKQKVMEKKCGNVNGSLEFRKLD